MKTQTRLAISLSNDPMDTEYVPLEELGNLLAEVLNQTCEYEDVMEAKVKVLTDKVEAANKILSKISVPKKAPYWDELSQLRAILSQDQKENG